MLLAEQQELAWLPDALLARAAFREQVGFRAELLEPVSSRDERMEPARVELPDERRVVRGALQDALPEQAGLPGREFVPPAALPDGQYCRAHWEAFHGQEAQSRLDVRSALQAPGLEFARLDERPGLADRVVQLSRAPGRAGCLLLVGAC